MLNNGINSEFRYAIEHLTIREANLSVQGWAHHPSKEIVRASVETGDRTVIVLKHHLPRPDVAEQSESEQALKSGFFGHGPMFTPGRTAYLVFSFNDGSREKIPLVIKGHRWQKLGQVEAVAKRGMILVSKIPLLLRQYHRETVKALIGQLRRGEFKRLFQFARQVVDDHQNAWTSHIARQSLLAAYAKLPNLAEALSCLAPSPLDITPLPEPVDVIVPIYNGVEFLPRLLESLLAHTPTCHRIILVDDASPDARVWPLLQEYAADRPHVILKQNEQNQGFIRTVNQAVQGVEHHFVLLNSDVEVPPGWLERLMSPIISRPDQVASTTPFSNAATICSFPEMNLDNELFADLPATRIDHFFQYLQPETEVALPTGIGFCMGFNHEVVKHIGLFDAETFGTGFGEENDWSQRALKIGYRHLLVPNLFIYHKHGGSFLESKKQRLEINLQKLKQLHPHYFESVREFCLEDPPGLWRAAMILKLAGCAASEPPLLIIDHDLGGGANRYRGRMINEALQRDRAVLLLLSVPHSEIMYVLVNYRQHRTTLVLKSPQDFSTLETVIPIGEIFYNNLVGYADPLAVLREIIALKTRSGAALTVAIHDYFPICPAYNLLNRNYSYCQPTTSEFCRECLPHNDLAAPVPDPDPVQWRENWTAALAVSDTILTFSESSRDIVSLVYPSFKGKIVVRPHESMTIFHQKPNINKSSGINIGVIGGINVPKGRNIVAALAQTIAGKRDDRLSLTVIGSLSPPLPEKTVTVTGPYHPEDLPDLIEAHGLNVFLIPSIWPETFSYVAQEIMDMGLPLCCFDIGAPAERVRRYARGLVLSNMDPEIILKEIEQFLKNLNTEIE